MADGSSVAERRIRPIQDAVASENWKQALKECEKWQKKGEKSDKFLALKAYVLVNQADRSQIDRGQSETLGLCSRTPAVTDFDAIRTLQDALRDLSLETQEGNKLWERAAAAKSGDKTLLMTWLDSCLEDSQWQSAQKAAMALRKAFPNDRNYDFWNILLCFLVHQDKGLGDKERTLFGTLAYRLVSKAVEGVPKSTEQVLSPGKAVTTPEEIALLVQIYLATGHANEAVNLLTGPSLSVESTVGGQDPALVVSLLLQALGATKDWPKTFEVCKRLLHSSNYKDDDRVWRLIKQNEECAKGSTDDQVGELLAIPATDGEKPSRCLLLKRLEQVTEKADFSPDEALPIYKEFFAAFANRSFAFSDLRPALERLDKQSLQTLASSFNSSSLAAELFALKTSRLCPSPDTKDLFAHATGALRLYDTSLDAGTPVLEAPILAALSLIQLSFSISSRALLLKATVILERCHSKHEDFFPASVLLVSLYRHLGFLSLALSTFSSLSVKNLQWETVGHLCLTRISTLHPHLLEDVVGHNGKKKILFSPLQAVESTLQNVDKVIAGLADSVKRGLREGSYSNILDAVDTKTQIDKSEWNVVCGLEERKLLRMTAIDLANSHPKVQWRQDVELNDLRDTSYLPRYSNGDEKVWTVLRCGPDPGAGWAAAMLLFERLLDYLDPVGEKEVKEREWAALEEEQQRASKHLLNDELNEGQLTGPEEDLYRSVLHVVDLVRSSKDGKNHDEDALAAVEKTLAEWLKEKHDVEHSGSWRHLHHWYVGYELSHLVHAFTTWAARASLPSAAGDAKGKRKGKAVVQNLGNPIPEDKLAQLEQLGVKLRDGIRGAAQQAKASLVEGGALGRIMEMVLPAEGEAAESGDIGGEGEREEKEFSQVLRQYIDATGGDGAAEVSVGKWLESEEDAYTGVLASDRVLGERFAARPVDGQSRK